MPRVAFNLNDITSECEYEGGVHQLDGCSFGLRIDVPVELYDRYPFNTTAYGFLQQLRDAIFEYGTIEFPSLPVNKINHTLCQRAPKQHTYSANPYMTGSCQHLHQDTPPLATAFWLDEPRRYYATWVTSMQALQHYYGQLEQGGSESFDGGQLEGIHRQLVPESLNNGTGLLLNQNPGLLLIDNSDSHRLYHARTCNFNAIDATPNYEEDAAMYAFNEQGLLYYIDQLDSRRGQQHRCPEDLAEVKAFLSREGRSI